MPQTPGLLMNHHQCRGFSSDWHQWFLVGASFGSTSSWANSRPFPPFIVLLSGKSNGSRAYSLLLDPLLDHKLDFMSFSPFWTPLGLQTWDAHLSLTNEDFYWCLLALRTWGVQPSLTFALLYCFLLIRQTSDVQPSSTSASFCYCLQQTTKTLFFMLPLFEVCLT